MLEAPAEPYRVNLQLTYDQVGMIFAMIWSTEQRLNGPTAELAHRQLNQLRQDMAEQIKEQTG